ncbi:MAG: hypothetical protein KIT63_24055 [Rhodoferax sp.]|nr:hypothetical protein [Rhodoferax sp.]
MQLKRLIDFIAVAWKRWSATLTRSPDSTSLSDELVTVIYRISELELTYADNDVGSRFFLDSKTRIGVKSQIGQRLNAKVTGGGYVVEATLAPDN